MRPEGSLVRTRESLPGTARRKGHALLQHPGAGNGIGTDRSRTMKKILCFLLLIGCILIFLPGCGEKGEQTVSEKERTEEFTDADIVIPAGLVGKEMPQDKAGRTEEGSPDITYSLSGEERSEIIGKVTADLEASIDAILSDEDRYPDVVSVTPSEDYKEFVIALADGRMNTYEAMLAMSFYIIGDKYQIYCGVPAQDAVTIVRYVDADTGDVINEADSSSMDTR